MTTPLPGSRGDRIGIVDGAHEGIISVEEFRERLDVDGWIRLSEADFAAALAMNGRLTHFNLGTTTNAPDLRYALVPIVRPGRRLHHGVEQLPYIDIARFRRATCLSVRQNVPLDAVGPDVFADSLPALRSPQALRAAMVARYARLHSGRDEAEILAAGCAVTLLALEP